MVVAGVVLIAVVIVGGYVYLQTRASQSTSQSASPPPINALVIGNLRYSINNQCYSNYACSFKRIDLTDIATRVNASAAPLFCDKCPDTSYRNVYNYSIIVPNQRTYAVNVLWTDYDGSTHFCDGGNLYASTDSSNRSVTFNVNC